MEVIEQLAPFLKGSATLFCRKFPTPFLVRRPIKTAVELGGQSSDAGGRIFEYKTSGVAPDEDGFLPWQWWVHPVVKKAGQAFSNAITLGRASTSDIHLPLSYVSKLHARFHLEEGAVVKVEDLDSVNGTYVDGRHLPPRRPFSIREGCKLRIGSLSLDYLSPKAVYEILRVHRGSMSPRDM